MFEVLGNRKPSTSIHLEHTMNEVLNVLQSFANSLTVSETIQLLAIIPIILFISMIASIFRGR